MCLESISASGGDLRQFMLDDKGLVVIWAFGLPTSSYEDNHIRAMHSARELCELLSTQGLSLRVGVTAGFAFCGRVGAERRCEYSVLGPSVNLAARLMCLCANKEVASEFERQEGRSFFFHTYPPIRVKGYDQPVRIFKAVWSASSASSPTVRGVGGRRSMRAMRAVASEVVLKMDQCGFRQQASVRGGTEGEEEVGRDGGKEGEGGDEGEGRQGGVMVEVEVESGGVGTDCYLLREEPRKVRSS
ncbi:MAG: hypothetical protein SGPRY_014998 [Prymnesium sp.]